MSPEAARPQPDDDDTDELFRSIVQHYGERPEVPETDSAPEPDPAPQPEAPLVSPGLFRLAGQTESAPEAADEFVPPPPPPFEWPEPRRGLAWVGLFGGPTLLLLALVVGITLPQWVTAVIALGFIGGFVFLVATMSQEPGDGWDDGARL